MGNEQSKKSSNVEIQLNHSRINFIRVINDPKRRYMQALFAVEKDDYNKWKTNLQKAKLISTHLLLPFQYTFQSKEFCGSAGSAQLNYENYPYLLLEQIENRRAKKKRFDQTELWLLLYCLLDSQKQMKQGNSSRIGDVRPQNIFFNEEGLMKVANILSWPKQTTNYQKFLQNQPTYLAPEDMTLIQLSQIDNQQNTQSQIFSIGLTLLSAANLLDYKGLYNTNARKFNLQEFSHIVNEWRLNDYYSDIFKATLCSLIEVDKVNRITEDVFFPWLEKYREEILARKDFVITDPPQLVINQVQVIRKVYQNVSASRIPQNLPLPSTLNPTAHSHLFNSDYTKIGLPFEGPVRLIEEKRFAPISVIPGNTVTDSIYNSAEKPTHLSNYLLQGAPITTTSPVFINRTSVPTVYENQTLTESSYVRNYGSQGGSNLPKTHFQYSQSPERKVEDIPSRVQGQTVEKKQAEQESNQPQIVEDKHEHQANKA